MTLRLHDLALADGTRISPYCHRVKMALALKGLDYETAPVGFTGIPGLFGGGVTRTVPVLEDGAARIVDSFAIAEHLETRHPGPALFVDGAAGRSAARLTEGYAVFVLQANAMPLVALSIHDRARPEDRAYFRQSREKRLGRSLEAAFADHETRLADYRRLYQPARHVLAHAPYFGGETALFVDAILYGTFTWLTRVSDLDWFGGDEVLAGWYQRCRAIVAPTER